MNNASFHLQREPLAHFPAAVPGYAQLRRLTLTGAFEVTFMFRTGQKRGVLLYAVDTNRFHYVSLALYDGALDLKVLLRKHFDLVNCGFLCTVWYSAVQYSTVRTACSNVQYKLERTTIRSTVPTLHSIGAFPITTGHTLLCAWRPLMVRLAVRTSVRTVQYFLPQFWVIIVLLRLYVR